ncbi:hypothetical protein CGRA01v4_14241 [Colletotrichum graminicola]|nr:hypothetical protein CGRA01v4_14241 [Colletotrichum graminicola]
MTKQTTSTSLIPNRDYPQRTNDPGNCRLTSPCSPASNVDGRRGDSKTPWIHHVNMPRAKIPETWVVVGHFCLRHLIIATDPLPSPPLCSAALYSAAHDPPCPIVAKAQYPTLYSILNASALCGHASRCESRFD